MSPEQAAAQLRALVSGFPGDRGRLRELLMLQAYVDASGKGDPRLLVIAELTYRSLGRKRRISHGSPPISAKAAFLFDISKTLEHLARTPEELRYARSLMPGEWREPNGGA